ncbi:DUF4262 domain-containing protein [Pseudonocardia humida]|uniref:DUF4262 domain-containing protein n=1 Tax=Pseudonocardia humida TaxID=2800819 RepID=A0ABT0ZXE1_9PSEU|nr:DUF4262 domain-containing protein [Pseudonocardia humida]MCO1655376.1 DUF4262 domain-containing protein [Pseudonocardia humida]
MDLPDRSPRSTHWADQYDAWQRETIRRHGWALQAVDGDEDGPPYVYTVGLSGFAHPELIVFATAQAAAARLLNELGELVRAGYTLVGGQRVAAPSGDVHLLAFPEAEHWLFAADDLYGIPGGAGVRALLVMPVDELVARPEDGTQRCACCAVLADPAG